MERNSRNSDGQDACQACFSALAPHKDCVAAMPRDHTKNLRQAAAFGDGPLCACHARAVGCTDLTSCPADEEREHAHYISVLALGLTRRPERPEAAGQVPRSQCTKE